MRIYIDIPDDLTGLSQRLKYLLKAKGITQAEFSRESGFSLQSVSYWFNGKREPNLKALCKMADIFGVSTDWLLGRVNA